jgi:hypothetical protein
MCRMNFRSNILTWLILAGPLRMKLFAYILLWDKESGTNRHQDTSAPVWDISVPRQIVTRTIRYLKKTNRYLWFFKVVLVVASFWSLFNQNFLNLISYRGHCENERSFSAPSILSHFWAFTQNFLNKSGLNWVSNVITCPALCVEWIFGQIF